MASALLAPVEVPIAERLHGMGQERRRAAYRSGALTVHELHVWAAFWPEEVPLVNGELPWITATLADLECRE
jgi:hypothetical protein